MRRRSVRISIDDIHVGIVLWLRKDANVVDPRAFQKSGFDLSALGHPCMVVDLLQRNGKNDSMLICTMSSRYKAWRSDVPLVNRQDSPLSSSVSSERPSDSNKSNTSSYNSNEVLTFAASSAAISKQSFVAAHRVFEVSLKMLQPFGKASDINMYRLNEHSLGVLRKRTATAIDRYRRETYFSSDAIPSFEPDIESDDEPWLIDFSDSEEEVLDADQSRMAQQETVHAIEEALKCWASLCEPEDEVLTHLRLAQQKALAYGGSSGKIAAAEQRSD